MRRIRNVYRYINPKQETIVVSTAVDEKKLTLLKELGFSIPLKQNESIIPNAGYNKMTTENVNGKEIIRKDLPKDEPYHQAIHWTLKDWAGNEHDGETIITKYRYRREYTTPYSEELKIVKSNNAYIICSNVLEVRDSERIRFVINLFLSVFGDFTVLDKELSNIKVKKLNFTILRPGKLTKTELEKIILQGKRKQSPSESKLILERFRFLYKYSENEEIMIGDQSFYGYYAIKTKKYWIVECNYTNNATYIFDENWLNYVKMTKQEVINGNLCIKRIYHTSSWKTDMLKYV